MNKINWHLISRLPADDEVYNGGPEYGAFKVSHKAATRHSAEMLLAEIGNNELARRVLIPVRNSPAKWSQSQLVAGRLL